MSIIFFLDASSHLYKRVCPSVGRSVGPSVRNAFVKIAETGVMRDGDASYVVFTALFADALLSVSNTRITDIEGDYLKYHEDATGYGA